MSGKLGVSYGEDLGKFTLISGLNFSTLTGAVLLSLTIILFATMLSSCSSASYHNKKLALFRSENCTGRCLEKSTIGP
jgi:hypothetical protein